MSCGYNETTPAASKAVTPARDGGTADNTVLVEFLFLDKETCQPCGGTARALEQVRLAIAPALELLGVTLELREIHAKDRATAVAHRLVSSPTIRVQGRDIDPAATEDDCPSCGSLTGGDAVDCRTWHWRGEVWKSAPPGRIAQAVLQAALDMSDDCCGQDCCGAETGNAEAADYALPANLEEFFEARDAGRPRCC